MNLKKMLGGFCIAAILGAAAGAASAAPTAAAGSHAKLPCSTCHADGKFAAPAKSTCLGCHESYEKVAERTAKMTPNPHASHRGEPDCSNCHSMHAKPRFECNDCHSFNIKMKGE